uniref:Uncharacterized protein n=1 Tax=Arundo donax TaxID=35708 RepID=A0A0A9HA17_ARUDO
MAESCNNFQNSLAYGGEVCDMTTPATNGLPPPLFAPSHSSQQMCAPQDMFFIGDDSPAVAASETRSHAAFFGGGDMGSVSEHELKWDDLACATNTFSTTTAATEIWNPAASPMLCRQASDGVGVDDLAAFFFSEENRVVF